MAGELQKDIAGPRPTAYSLQPLMHPASQLTWRPLTQNSSQLSMDSGPHDRFLASEKRELHNAGLRLIVLPFVPMFPLGIWSVGGERGEWLK